MRKGSRRCSFPWTTGTWLPPVTPFITATAETLSRCGFTGSCLARSARLSCKSGDVCTCNIAILSLLLISINSMVFNQNTGKISTALKSGNEGAKHLWRNRASAAGLRNHLCHLRRGRVSRVFEKKKKEKVKYVAQLSLPNAKRRKETCEI